jgi:uncharacterized protein YndB with AHSA1/START domain
MIDYHLTAPAGKQEIRISCVFDAPCDLVWKTYLDPALIPEWWGPSYLTTTVDKLDAHPGGQWRFVQKDAQGNIHAFHGFYHALNSPSEMVFTFEYEGTPGHVLLETVQLIAEGGKTRMADLAVFQSVEDRDGMLQEGMEDGSKETMERFAKLLERLTN